MQNKYLEDLPQESIDRLKFVMNTVEYEDSEDWATKLGQYYVRNFGRPSEYDSFFGVGASLIKAFKEEQC
jgi:hypothetical protein